MDFDLMFTPQRLSVCSERLGSYRPRSHPSRAHCDSGMQRLLSEMFCVTKFRSMPTLPLLPSCSVTDRGRAYRSGTGSSHSLSLSVAQIRDANAQLFSRWVCWVRMRIGQ
jgi:hypothetical protein